MLISVYSHNQCEHITDLLYNVTKQFSFDSQLVDVSLVCLRFLVLWSRTATPKKTWIEKGINIFSNNFTNTQLGPLTRKSNSNSGIDFNNSSSDKSLLGFFPLSRYRLDFFYSLQQFLIRATTCLARKSSRQTPKKPTNKHFRTGRKANS